MTTDAVRMVEAWQDFQLIVGGTERPQTEQEYVELLEVLDTLTERYDCNEAPYASLFDLLAGYARQWEEANEAPVPDVAPHEMLAFYMEQQGVSQYQLEQEGVADQSTLSKILRAKRGISKELAKKLGRRFKVNPVVFL